MKVNLRISPAERNFPISPLFNEHAEKLSFPEKSLSQFGTFRDGVTVIPFTMTRNDFKSSDGVTPSATKSDFHYFIRCSDSGKEKDKKMTN